MNANLNFTLVNFQDHSTYATFWIERTVGTEWQEWRQLYVTDISLDGRVIGKAHCCFGYEEWAKDLKTLDEQDWYSLWPKVNLNFTLNGLTWYNVSGNNEDGQLISKWSAEEGWESMSGLDYSFEEILPFLCAYDHLAMLVSAVAAKEPPKQP
jgi:hypothetical protein